MKVPYIEKNNIEGEAEYLIASYEKKYGLIDSLYTPIDSIVEHHLGITIDVQELDDDVLGCIDVHNKAISINQNLDPHNYKNMEGRYNFTLGHETGHYILHKELVAPVMPSLFEDNAIEKPSGILCRKSDYKEPIEWQADYFSGCVLMQKTKVYKHWGEYMGSHAPYYFDKSVDSSEFIEGKLVLTFNHNSYLQTMFEEFAKTFRVSSQAMIIRLKELGLLVENTSQRVAF